MSDSRQKAELELILPEMLVFLGHSLVIRTQPPMYSSTDPLLPRHTTRMKDSAVSNVGASDVMSTSEKDQHYTL